jgi:hypothetical protein
LKSLGAKGSFCVDIDGFAFGTLVRKDRSMHKMVTTCDMNDTVRRDEKYNFTIE